MRWSICQYLEFNVNPNIVQGTRDQAGVPAFAAGAAFDAALMAMTRIAAE